MYLATINGWPELGILVAWNDTQTKKLTFPSQCELVLATHNGHSSYKNSVLLKRGFEPVVHFKTGRVLLARFFPKYLVKD